jgi:hypothetical protein
MTDASEAAKVRRCIQESQRCREKTLHCPTSSDALHRLTVPCLAFSLQQTAAKDPRVSVACRAAAEILTGFDAWLLTTWDASWQEAIAGIISQLKAHIADKNVPQNRFALQVRVV